MGKDYNRPATNAEVADMAKLVQQGMRQRAFGLSTGLEYDVGHPSTPMFVNGEPVWEQNRVTSRLPGKVIRKGN
jgi:N-acyl-D-aspartate/D-glutamate deacylase